ncbi:MAG: ABC transporter ATP-binding protein [Oscillospiraceae bacterium]|nr:ABC transporter ATP-binding protein [Oscillospiraceae bacterium]
MMNKKGQTAVLRKVILRLRKYWLSMIGSLLLALVYVVLSLSIPVLVGQAIDHIIGKGAVNFAAVGANLIAVAVCAALAALAQWCMSALNNHVTYRVGRDLRDEAFSHIQKLPLRYLDTHPRGDMVSRVVSDVDTFADGLLMGFTQLFTGVMTIAGTLILMLSINWKIALVVICITPVSLLVANFIAQKTFSMFQLQTKIRGEQTATIEETLGNLKVVKAFGHENASMEQFDEVNNRMEKCSLRAIFFSSLVNPSTRFVNSLVYAGVGLVGALVAINGGITVGVLSIFLNYANQYTKPFNEISGVVTELQNALACAARVFELIEEPAQSEDPQKAVSPGELAGAVEIRNLYFSYTPEKPLIQGLQLSVRPGQRVAIVGPTGCGKTTFINLLMRFYDPDAGEICLDGIDTMKMNRGSLRKNVGMVLQDTWLHSGTVRENIAMGKSDASEEEIIAAARQAHAHSFIMRLPNGYDTVIGESGGTLSQGQKQLLCIARVMLCLPPMLFLDEATSSIDTRTELHIQKAFDTMMQGRTSFIVAHRLSTIQEADIILVMRNGTIVEQGTHDDLLKKRGFYSELYRSQFAH